MFIDLPVIYLPCLEKYIYKMLTEITYWKYNVLGLENRGAFLSLYTFLHFGKLLTYIVK